MKEINCEELLDKCLKLMTEADKKRYKYTKPEKYARSLNIVLPVDYVRALRYYFASKPGAQVSVL